MPKIVIQSTTHSMIAAQAADIDRVMKGQEYLPDGRVRIEIDEEAMSVLEGIDPDPDKALLKVCEDLLKGTKC